MSKDVNENENTNNGILENNNSIKNESSNLEFLENLKVKTKKYQRDEHLNKINKLLKDINAKIAQNVEIKKLEEEIVELTGEVEGNYKKQLNSYLFISSGCSPVHNHAKTHCWWRGSSFKTSCF